MSGVNPDIPGTSDDGMAGSHYRAVRHSADQLRVTIESTRLTRDYGEKSVETADRVGMSGLYLDTSTQIMVLADEAVKALQQAQGKLEALAAMLVRQGA